MHRFIQQRADPHSGNSPSDFFENAKSPEPVFGWSVGPDGSDLTRVKLLDEMLKIHEYERQRLGQELHDSAGQLVTALQLSIAHLRILEGHSGHEELVEEIQDNNQRIDLLQQQLQKVCDRRLGPGVVNQVTVTNMEAAR